MLEKLVNDPKNKVIIVTAQKVVDNAEVVQRLKDINGLTIAGEFGLVRRTGPMPHQIEQQTLEGFDILKYRTKLKSVIEGEHLDMDQLISSRPRWKTSHHS